MIRTLAILALLAVPATAQEDGEWIKLDYESFGALEAPVAPYWSDIPAGGSSFPGRVFMVNMPTSNGGTFVVTMSTAGGVCGLNECPVRIFEDGFSLHDFNACSDPEQHYLSVDGKRFRSCGEDTDLSLTVPSPGFPTRE